MPCRGMCLQGGTSGGSAPGKNAEGKITIRTVQLYNIHLTNGEVLQVGEDYDLHGAQTIVNRFYKAGDNDILEFQTPFTSMYVPRKHILFIATADVLT